NRYYANRWYGNRFYGGLGFGWPYYGGYWPYYSGSTYNYPYVNAYPYVDTYPYSYTDPYAAYDTPAPSYNVANSASVEVVVPDPNATVWFDGAVTNQKGTDRWFQTPVLESNATYTIRASWNDGGRMVTRDKSVVVTPGETSVVNFTY